MAEIATVYVSVLPETSKIADGIARALRSADNDVRAAARRWRQDIQRELKEVDVKVDADTAKAKKKLDQLDEKHTATVDVEVDGAAKAEAEIDAVAGDRKATVSVDVDGAALAATSTAITTALTGGGKLAQAGSRGDGKRCAPTA